MRDITDAESSWEIVIIEVEAPSIRGAFGMFTNALFSIFYY
jgi:hypothetical protein